MIMTQEEKAKAYDEAVKLIKDNLDALNEIAGTGAFVVNIQSIRNCFYRAFPELNESEDERIRKAIHIYLDWLNGRKDHQPKGDYTIRDMIAWLEKQGDKDKLIQELGEYKTKYTQEVLSQQLEKQGEQKPADKVEPKFKAGDWINGYYTNYKVLSVNNDGYLVEDVDGNKINILFENEKFHHLFTIADAKSGDVLYSPCLSLLWIFKSKDTVYCGCNLNYNDGAFCGEGYIETPTDVIPATKEQHDLLFQKMKEAGYEWSEETHELKKIEPSEMIEALRIEYEKGRADTIAEMKTAWSEEDEKSLNRIVDALESMAMDYNVADAETLDKDISWLKSLKERYTWKPSDAQMASITCAVRKMKESACYDSELVSLLNDLKKLKRIKL